jgi:tripartite-type tricarboxylate transporter receptor subunit TctC
MTALRKSAAGLALMLLALSGQAAAAQWAPGKSVRIVVPFPPGGTADVIARLLAQQITQSSGQAFVVENRPGAGTIIATEAVAKAAADGTALLLMANSFVINPSLRSNLSYDPLTSFEPICLLATSPQILVVNGASPFHTVADLVTAARGKPGELSIATNGPATTQHIAAEMFKRATGVNLTYVPYAGGIPAVTALLGGHVTAVVANYSEMMEHVPSGKLRPLAVTASERFEPLPDVPTMAEAGYPDVLATAWFGMVAPAKTPKDTVAQIGAALTSALAVPDIRAKLVAQGLYPNDTCGADFGAHLQREAKDYARVIKDANIKEE